MNDTLTSCFSAVVVVSPNISHWTSNSSNTYYNSNISNYAFMGSY